MQPDAADRLVRGLARLGLAASAEQVSLWLSFIELLYRWNRVHSLTAVPDAAQAVDRHLLDALAVWPSLAEVLAERGESGPVRILDVGSGTGVPGIPLAIALPLTHWLLVERVARKAAFLRQAVARLGLSDRVRVAQADVRDLTSEAGYEVILSRAFAALPRFVQWTAHLAHVRTHWAYLAGRLERIAGLQPLDPSALAAPEPLRGLRVRTVALGQQNEPLQNEPHRNEPQLNEPQQNERHLIWVSQLE